MKVIGDIVTVLDVSNYQSAYQEKVPFKAVLFEIVHDHQFWVTSIITGRQYELYSSQILELDGNPEDYGIKI